MYKIRTNTLWSCLLPNVLNNKKVAVIFQSNSSLREKIESRKMELYFNKRNFYITDRGIFTNSNKVEKVVSFYTVQSMGKEKIDMCILHNKYDIVYAIKTAITTEVYFYKKKQV